MPITRGMVGKIVVVVALILFVLPAQALDFPALSGRVVDEANILDAGVRAALTKKLADLEGKTTNQLVVVTLKSLQGTTIEDFGVQLGRRWQVGQQGKNNGVLLIVAPNERKVRIEVGYGLEGALTDAVSRLIIENSILPRFRANDYSGGISRGADDIIQVLSGDAAEFKQRAAQRPDGLPPWVLIAIALAVFLVVATIVSMLRQTAGPPSALGRRRRNSGWSGWSSGSSSGSSWSSGSSSSGGFSGGGGSFGGGGSSGSW